MGAYRDMDREELQAEYEAQKRAFDAWKAKGLVLNMARGKPSGEQLELSMPLLDALDSSADCFAEDGTDVRNYGGLAGIPEARRLLGTLLDAPEGCVVVTGASSLNAEYDTLVRYLLFGTQGFAPWVNCEGRKWLCPVPGYDRHFAMAAEFGFELIPVPLTGNGPDMDAVERLAADPAVKGIWCVPQYSNPDSCTYAPEVVERLATMACGAPDFRILWDNAYAVHHLDGARAAHVADIGAACEAAGNPWRYVKFASTSKITFPGAGIAGLAACPEAIAEVLSHMAFQTVGPDKVNQLRHVRFLSGAEGITRHMEREAEILRPKFAAVQEILGAGLGEAGIATWTDPAGGYFVFFRSEEGCAGRIVALAKEAGVTLTKAGATWPYGIDPADRDIRIAPTFPSLEELRQALEVFVVCVKLATLEKLLGL
ncbi:MAG: aminotransferase [Eggerthellaceae bacterium]|nr:aminotransferase [Eggerthellaceae bacterium]